MWKPSEEEIALKSHYWNSSPVAHHRIREERSGEKSELVGTRVRHRPIMMIYFRSKNCQLAGAWIMFSNVQSITSGAEADKNTRPTEKKSPLYYIFTTHLNNTPAIIGHHFEYTIPEWIYFSRPDYGQ